MSKVIRREKPETAPTSLRADNAGCGAGEDGLHGSPAGVCGGDGTAVRLHDAESAACSETVRQAREIAGHQRRDVGVDGGGGPAFELAVLRQNFVGGGDEEDRQREGLRRGRARE